MGGFVVQDNIPIARKAVARQRSPLRKALADLEIGQCVTVFPEPGQSMKALRARLSGLTQGAKQDNPEAHYLHRTVDAVDPDDEEGVERKAIRIWRVTEDQADPHKSKGKPASKKKAASKKKVAAAATVEPVQEAYEPPPEDAHGTESFTREPDPELTDAEAAAEYQREYEADVNAQLDAEQEEEETVDDVFGEDWDEEEEDWDEEEDTGEEEEDEDLDRPVSFPSL